MFGTSVARNRRKTYDTHDSNPLDVEAIEAVFYDADRCATQVVRSQVHDIPEMLAVVCVFCFVLVSSVILGFHLSTRGRLLLPCGYIESYNMDQGRDLLLLLFISH